MIKSFSINVKKDFLSQHRAGAGRCILVCSHVAYDVDSWHSPHPRDQHIFVDSVSTHKVEHEVSLSQRKVYQNGSIWDQNMKVAQNHPKHVGIQF